MIYGTIYGMGPRGLSQKLQSSEAEAQKLMDSFRAAYPKMAQFLLKIMADAETNKYCETLSGRRRYFPKTFKSKEERIAVNTTVQVSIFHIEKKLRL